MLVHGHDCSVHWSHGQRIRRARLKQARSFTPNPPNRFSLLTFFQLTKQLPFRASSAPFQRKFLRIRSIHLMAHLDNGKDVMWYTGIEDDRTEFTKVRRPVETEVSFHPGNLAPILSTSTYSSSLLVLPTCRGKPRYLHGEFTYLTAESIPYFNSTALFTVDKVQLRFL